MLAALRSLFAGPASPPPPVLAGGVGGLAALWSLFAGAAAPPPPAPAPAPVLVGGGAGGGIFRTHAGNGIREGRGRRGGQAARDDFLRAQAQIETDIILRAVLTVLLSTDEA